MTDETNEINEIDETNEAQDRKDKVQKKSGILAQKIPLAKIVVSHNPRRPLKKLQDEGFEPMALVHEYALSEDSDMRAHFCKMIEDNQPEIVDLARTMFSLPDADLPEGVEPPEFVVDIETTKMQIQPIMLRDFRSRNENGEWEVRYGIAAGERRYIACAYHQAKMGKKTTVLAIVKKLTVQEAYWLGVEENLQREEMDEIEKGTIYHQWAMENGRDGRPAPIAEVARHFNRSYHEVRGRAALATLAPERQTLLRSGKLNLTDAINEALGETVAKTKPNRKGTRLVPLSIKEIRCLFDATPRSNTERLAALAEVMKLTLAEAIQESDARLDLLEVDEAREAEAEVTRQAS